MGGYYYTTAQGDMWDYIAWKVYEDESFIQTLLSADENRELLETYIFSAGIKVWCPYVEVDDTNEEEEVPDWRTENEEDDE